MVLLNRVVCHNKLLLLSNRDIEKADTENTTDSWPTLHRIVASHYCFLSYLQLSHPSEGSLLAFMWAKCALPQKFFSNLELTSIIKEEVLIYAHIALMICSNSTAVCGMINSVIAQRSQFVYLFITQQTVGIRVKYEHSYTVKKTFVTWVSLHF